MKRSRKLVKLDEKDLIILRELELDSSRNVTKMAEALGMPRTTVQDRISKLRKMGVIKRFTVKLDKAKLGKAALAFVLVSFMPGADISQKSLAHQMAMLEDVEEAHLISGEWDILLKVRGSSMKEIGDLVIDKIRSMRGVARTLTCAVFYTAKEDP
ncbi:MAG: Lrp/AsnC family transcriptional regulator [Nitrososphaeria archaeon]|nr:Lrp/AsnC family transcriptional regulator [Aigarchaeota archaeon]MCX8187441.1 Lrp/AsnC family transcriptional regulator [Nitrososphaeria archaeon]MDW8021099.1 Lrp/AsnC family transcriptional regulator [Nitrososphaerota archaeon]